MNFIKKQPDSVVYSYGYFHRKIEIITEATNLDELYKRAVDEILEKIEKFQNRGSGWKFNKVINLDLHIEEYKPIAARPFTDLPAKLKLKKAIVNQKN